ncbi:MAG: amidohydrolase [Planctomycetota bacterium]
MHRSPAFIPALLLAATSSVAAAPQDAAPADTVIVNARIWSDGLPAFAPTAAIRDGAFIHVGETVDDFTGPNTEIINVNGAVVLPGLIDSHVHMLGGGQQLSQLQLREADSKMDFIARVADWAAALPQDAWILGGRWSTESWPSIEQPTKDWLDDVTGDRPLFLPRMDGHSAIVNSKALEIAGITADGPENPVGGVIDRDPVTNEPTGILRESAMSLVGRFIPQPDLNDDVAALRRAMDHALSNGVTTVADIPSLTDLDAYERLARDGAPPVRFYLYVTADDWMRVVRARDNFDGLPGFIEINGAKAYLDGSLGSRTAMMTAPFLNNEPERPDWSGLWAAGVEDGQFATNIVSAMRGGLQPIVHAIGDEANRALLDMVMMTYGEDVRTARPRSEHAQHLRAEDIPIFAERGVIASMQPFHKADDGRYAEDYLGEQRCRSSYAYKSLLDAGAVLVFGSDWPVVTINPLLGMETAVTGRILDGTFWQTQENITVAEALRAYTSSAAYGIQQEGRLGVIAPGARADFIVLDGSPFGAEVDWSSIRVRTTYVDGKKVWVAE